MAFFTTAASVVGLLGGVKSLTQGDKNGGAGATSSSSAPWEPAQPYLKQNLQTNADLQKFYQQSPFSDLQKQQYKGLLDVLANNQSAGNSLLNNASAFGKSNRGLLGQMEAMPTGTKAPEIDWDSMNPYKSQAFKTSEMKQGAPTTYQAGQSADPVWEDVLAQYNAASQARFGTPMNRSWDADPEAQAQYQKLLEQYMQMKGG
jgi:hypothetical protein